MHSRKLKRECQQPLIEKLIEVPGFETAKGCSYLSIGVGSLMSLAGSAIFVWLEKNHIQERFFELRFSVSYFVLTIF